MPICEICDPGLNSHSVTYAAHRRKIYESIITMFNNAVIKFLSYPSTYEILH